MPVLRQVSLPSIAGAALLARGASTAVQPLPVVEETFHAPRVTRPIRIGDPSPSKARWVWRDQACIDALLRVMIAAMERTERLREEWLVPSRADRGGSR